MDATTVCTLWFQASNITESWAASCATVGSVVARMVMLSTREGSSGINALNSIFCPFRCHVFVMSLLSEVVSFGFTGLNCAWNSVAAQAQLAHHVAWLDPIDDGEMV